MLYREIIAAFPVIRTKHRTTLCVQKVEFVSVKTGSPYSNQWAFKC